jgi:hypothetical protein
MKFSQIMCGTHTKKITDHGRITAADITLQSVYTIDDITYQQCLKHIYVYCIVISAGCFVQK